MCKREREGAGPSPPGLQGGGASHTLPTLGRRDVLMALSLLYPDVFLSISWALDLEMERASSGNEFFKELLLGSKTKLRIGEARG